MREVPRLRWAAIYRGDSRPPIATSDVPKNATDTVTFHELSVLQFQMLTNLVTTANKTGDNIHIVFDEHPDYSDMDKVEAYRAWRDQQTVNLDERRQREKRERNNERK